MQDSELNSVSMLEIIRKIYSPKIVSDHKGIYFAEIAITNKCNLDCTHCSRQSMNSNRLELTNDVIGKFLEAFKKHNGEMVCFTGGEPLMIKELLFDSISTAKSLGLYPSLISNGHLVDSGVALKLKDLGLESIGISINGGPDFHDLFVNMKGAYKKSVTAIQNAVDAGINCSIVVVPTNLGIRKGEFQHLLDLAKTLEVGVYVNFPTLSGRLKNNRDALLSRENIEYIYQLGREGLIRKDVICNNRMERKCPAVRGQVYVSPFGDLCPCPFIQLSFGNIFKNSFDDILENIKKSGYEKNIYTCCPPAEDIRFMRKIIEPIYRSKVVPVHVAEHPEFRSIF